MHDLLKAQLFPFLLDPATWAWVFGVVVALVTWKRKDRARKIEAFLDRWVPVVYEVVNQIARKTDNAIDDKLAVFLDLIQARAAEDGFSGSDVASILSKAEPSARAYHEVARHFEPLAGPTSPSPDTAARGPDKGISQPAQPSPV